MRDPFDQLVKRIGARALGPRGPVAVEHEVAPNSRAVDVWFQPDRSRAAKWLYRDLLDRMTAGPSILEAFHNTPGIDDFRGCVHKQLGIDSRRCAEARRKKRSRPTFPQLWIISTGRPVGIVEAYGFSPLGGFPAGVLGRRAADAVGIVVLRELPRDRDTLLLRLMGAGEVLDEAIADLKALPEGARERQVAWDDLVDLRFRISRNTRVKAEREFLMSTDRLEYWRTRFVNEGIKQGLAQGHTRGLAQGHKRGLAQGHKRGLAQGHKRGLAQGHKRGLAQGHEQGVKEALCTLYRSRFGKLPRSIAATIAATHDLATLTRWVALVATASSADVAAALRQRNGCPPGFE